MASSFSSSAAATGDDGVTADPVVVVVYGTTGGMGDVGKFVAMHALRTGGGDDGNNRLTVRLVAMSLEAEEGGKNTGDKGFSPDVTDTGLQHDVASILEAADNNVSGGGGGGGGGGVVKVDVGDPAGATKALVRQFAGADAVVACVGNRQPNMARWVAAATQQIVDAMTTAGVARLVQLSSMGIGDDRLQLGFVKALWWTMLRTTLRTVRADLEQAEAIIRASPCDYVLVRPMGLTPSEPPRGVWAVLHEEKGSLGLSVAKGDVAAFMLQEALRPTYSRTAVTIGPRAS